ncbi:Fur family transcriptional regulator [Salinicoccus halodurans]|uniref:Ferric uptake regulation protein n=1 Tax=Salinicoccus halodurans TaxID=407035 RepID=A0A0F7HM76_9STAP|nr:Fur family transcriptional regulator [Salinicoccus halodurans]AKG73994.1 Fur family transcriptional regulator [Salinicoccus halodurans]SFK58932.1 zinc uptake regulator, Fur family [Salinicoccus halodurans]
MTQQLNQYKDKLKEKKLKITDKRMRMIDLFLDEERYLSAREVQEKMNKEFPGISYDTIYRNLYTLNDIEVLEKTTFDGEMQYKISCTSHHHHHFICNSCGDTKVIHYCPVDTWADELNDVEITNHKVELYGLCKSCR